VQTKQVLKKIRELKNTPEQLRKTEIINEVAYVVDICFTVLSYKSLAKANTELIQELGRNTERLLAEWRQDAVNHLRPAKDYKA